MAHFAKIENDVVVDVIVIDNQYELEALDYIRDELKLEGEWIQTSYNHSIRHKFAGVGDTYDRKNDVFIVKQPYPSWSLTKDFEWQSPKPYPDDGESYFWDEDKKDWMRVDVS